MRLIDEYNKGVQKGLITEEYSKWRGAVISRINKLYGTNYKNLSNEQILRYMQEGNYEKTQRKVIRFPSNRQ